MNKLSVKGGQGGGREGKQAGEIFLCNTRNEEAVEYIFKLKILWLVAIYLSKMKDTITCV